MSLIYNPLKQSNLKDDLMHQIKSYANRKCNLKNKIGLITPQFTDDFISLHKRIETENSATTNTNEINTNKNSSEDFCIKTAELCTKKIISDSSKVIVQCKPMMNSTASKTLVKEYSESRRYKEDKLILFPSIKESNKEKDLPKENDNINKTNINVNNVSNISNISNINENNESEYDDIDEIIKYQESHLPVPLSKKDDEKFKILKMKQMKRVSMPSYKSVRKFAEDSEPQYEKEFRIHNAFSSMKKKKPVHSNRRLYFSNFFLHKKNKKPEAFMVFRDKDIGIYEYWQAHIHESHNDEDVETDDEQKKIARNFSISEVKEGLEYIRNNGDEAFVNFNRYADFLNRRKDNDILDEIKDNLEIYVFNDKDGNKRSKYSDKNNN